MPKLNLRGEGMEDETQPVGPTPEEAPPPPTLRDISGGEGPSPLLQILLGLLILAVGIRFAIELVIRPDELFTIRETGVTQ